MTRSENELPTRQRRTLRILLGGNVVQAMGLQLFVPILPLYLSARGSSVRLVGITIAAGIAGYGLAQFPSGWIADRFDRRSVMVLGMAVYAALFLVYLLPIPVDFLPAVRFVHAAVGGLYSVASLAMLGDLTPPSQRGHIFGLWQATTRSGFLIGPLIGGAVATIQLSVAFVGSTVVYGAATLIMMRLPKVPTVNRHERVAVPSLPVGSLLRTVLPLVGIAAAGDYCTGAFNSIWSLWLGSHGATPWEVGVSFCLFAVPAVALSTFFGALTDRRGPQRIVVASLVGMACIAPLCALHSSVMILTIIGVAIGFFSTPNRPVVFAAASREFTSQYVARAQGTLQGGLMGVQFIAALASSALLAVSAVYAFGALSLVAVGSLTLAVRRPACGPAIVTAPGATTA